MSYEEQLAQIEAMYENGGEILDPALSLGQETAKDEDVARVIQGRLVQMLDRRYSQSAVKTFAQNVGRSQKTVYTYAALVNHFGTQYMLNILNETPLYYTHFRDAYYAYPNEPDKAIKWVEECALNNYTVAEAKRLLKEKIGEPQKRRKLIDAPCRLDGVNTINGTIVLFVGDAVLEMANLRGQTLDTLIYEPIEIKEAA